MPRLRICTFVGGGTHAAHTAALFHGDGLVVSVQGQATRGEKRMPAIAEMKPMVKHMMVTGVGAVTTSQAVQIPAKIPRIEGQLAGAAIRCCVHVLFMCSACVVATRRR